MARSNNSLRLILTLLLSLLASQTHGFFPTQWREYWAGKDGLTHEAQTIQVFDSLARQYFYNIPKLTKSMRKARDEIVKGNIDVDDDQTHSALHFDGENITGGMTRLVNLKAACMQALSNMDASGARHNLGQALHTLQDFYAHSNWVELGNADINYKLGHDTTMDHAPFDEPTCRNCTIPPITQSICIDCQSNVITSNLTTGYYLGEDSPANGVPIPDYKCRHGGTTDSASPIYDSYFGFVTPGINKDSGGCQWSPHSHLHQAAAALAIKATEKFIQDIVSEMNNEAKTRMLFGVNGDLGFAVDVSGSMEGSLDYVKWKIKKIASTRSDLDEPNGFVLSTFDDRIVDYAVKWNFYEGFASVLDRLATRSDNGDCAELCISGIQRALGSMEGPGVLFVFTDAPPADKDLANQVITMAKDKQIKVSIIKIDGCTDNNLANRDLSDDVYGLIASATGGTLFKLGNEDIDLTQGLDLVTQDYNGILRIDDSVTDIESWSVPVDSEIRDLTFHVRTENEISVEVRTPDNLLLDTTTRGVTVNDMHNEVFINIDFPISGNWTMSVMGSGNYSLDVYCISPLRFTSLDFVTLRGRSGHTGYYPTQGQPAYDHEVAAVGNLAGNFADLKLNLRDLHGQKVAQFRMRPGSDEAGAPSKNSFYGRAQLVPGDAIAYVYGTDLTGLPFQRYLPKVFTPVLSGTNDTGFAEADPWNPPPNVTISTTTTSITTASATPTSAPNNCPSDSVSFPEGPQATCQDGYNFRLGDSVYQELCARDRLTENGYSYPLNRTECYNKAAEVHHYKTYWRRTTYTWEYICILDITGESVPTTKGQFDYLIRLDTNPCWTPRPKVTSCPVNETIPTGPPMLCQEGALFSRNGHIYQYFCNRQRVRTELKRVESNFTTSLDLCGVDGSACRVIASRQDLYFSYYYDQDLVIPDEPGNYDYAVKLCAVPTTSSTTKSPSTSMTSSPSTRSTLTTTKSATSTSMMTSSLSSSTISSTTSKSNNATTITSTTRSTTTTVTTTLATSTSTSGASSNPSTSTSTKSTTTNGSSTTTSSRSTSITSSGLTSSSTSTSKNSTMITTSSSTSTSKTLTSSTARSTTTTGSTTTSTAKVTSTSTTSSRSFTTTRTATSTTTTKSSITTTSTTTSKTSTSSSISSTTSTKGSTTSPSTTSSSRTTSTTTLKSMTTTTMTTTTKITTTTTSTLKSSTTTTTTKPTSTTSISTSKITTKPLTTTSKSPKSMAKEQQTASSNTRMMSDGVVHKLARVVPTVPPTPTAGRIRLVVA